MRELGCGNFPLACVALVAGAGLSFVSAPVLLPLDSQGGKLKADAEREFGTH